MTRDASSVAAIGLPTGGGSAGAGGRSAEVLRQRAILDAVFAPDRAAALCALTGAGVRGTPDAREAGLGAYRGNSLAIAERALQAAYPVTFQLLRESAASAAAHLWRSDPPRSGDLADWGAGFGDWLAAQPSLADWPQLPGCAAIEWACHCAARAVDTATDVGSLALLSTHDAASLYLHLKPDVWLVAGAPGFYETWREKCLAAGEALAAAQSFPPCMVAVWRDGFVPRVLPLDAAWSAWLQALVAGASLQDLLVALPEPDLETTLASLITHGWLLDIHVCKECT